MRLLKFTLLSACIMASYNGFAQESVNWWLTSADKSALVAKQVPIPFAKGADNALAITVDPAQKFQTIDGFGFALTGGSAQLMMEMSAAERKKLIQELFGTANNGIGVSYLRVSIGASDMNAYTFSYDDLPPGETDVNMKKFTLKEDEKDVIPVLKEILAINPKIKILGSPWSGPVWMKSNNNIQDGRLKDEYYPAYAKYFVKYITGMKQHGITIDAITVQNEPFNNGNTPSMQFLAKEELRFIKNNLGPAFKVAGIKTKIILYDHNCDAPEYPISILTDPEARKYIDGSGFHLYTGQVSAMSKVHDAFPNKGLYFTEMNVTNRGGFNVGVPVERILIGATRNWSRNVILWNLAADPNNKPHTDNGGCPSCSGAITIDKDKVTRNVAYYSVAQFSQFVPDNSVRISSTLPDVASGLSDVAFKTPAGKIVLVVANKGTAPQSFSVSCQGKTFSSSIVNGSVATYIW